MLRQIPRYFISTTTDLWTILKYDSETIAVIVENRSGGAESICNVTVDTMGVSRSSESERILHVLEGLCMQILLPEFSLAFWHFFFLLFSFMSSDL